MKKIVLLLIISFTFLFSKDSFIEVCKNPTPEQKIVINGIIDYSNSWYPSEEYHIHYTDENICEVLKNKSFPDLPSKNISDISLLKYFPNTPTLNLWNNKITDITPLKYLTKLTKLNLGLNKVSKGVESLEELSLKELSIDITDDIDLKYIGNIKTLESLSLLRGKNYQALNNLTKIKDLSLLSVNIKSLCDLKGLQLLEELDLRGNNLKSLECIDQFPNLKKLRIERSPITDLTPLINADSITQFHFHDMPVSDISPLAKMKNLRSILFTKTKIKYLSPLKESKSIQFAEDLSEKFIEEYFNRSLAWCSPKSMKEVRAGKTCLNEDGSVKPWWKRMIGL